FEFGVLYALARTPDGALRLSVLAEYSNSTLSRLSRAVTRLEARGWVRREVDPTDGRYTLAILPPAGSTTVREALHGHLATAARSPPAILSPAGSTTVREALPGHLALVERVVFGALTPAQARTLGAACERINTAISPARRWEQPG